MIKAFGYLFSLVVIILCVVGVFSLISHPDSDTRATDIRIILYCGDQNWKITGEIMDGLELSSYSVKEIWSGEIYQYECMSIADFIEEFIRLPPSTVVEFINLTGDSVEIPAEDLLKYRDSFLFAVKYDGVFLKPEFENSPQAGGPLKILVHGLENEIAENYGARYWLWCVREIRIII
ncbi:MAG: hypothetical protein ACXQTP_07165 [Candidatus Methanofastidiosia archaeon]